MARRIYIVELEIEAETEAKLPKIDEIGDSGFAIGDEDDSTLTVMLMKAADQRIARMGLSYSLEGIQVIGTREG